MALMQGLALVALGQDPIFLFLFSIGQTLGPCLSSSRVMGTQVLGERGEDLSGFFRLDRDVMMSFVLMPVLHQGAFMEGDESPQSD